MKAILSNPDNRVGKDYPKRKEIANLNTIEISIDQIFFGIESVAILIPDNNYGSVWKLDTLNGECERYSDVEILP